ncbi:Thioredoxin reductase [Arachidicoccus rhizosphaerae]|uniref:Thioredoxin reductase n=2 Tax=Arachidicoccus rhizosphaerae TaxID=551991 RepID=A0A1H4C6M5_9BACT|nr:Thioredoxin reductase [Arachidicoccus rhizosphaerae]
MQHCCNCKILAIFAFSDFYYYIMNQVPDNSQRTTSKASNSTVNNTHEVIIIGGSYSGMQAALTLGRALRQVLIIDAGKPCNRFAPQAHNLLGSEGTPPAELHQNARKQIAAYPGIQLLEDQVVNVYKQQDTFIIHTASGQRYSTAFLVMAAGLQDILPDIDGVWECWGKSIIHCPYCHGYEFKGARTALLISSDRDLHMVSMLKQWTPQLQVIVTDERSLSAPSLSFLRREKISLIQGRLTAVKHEDGQLQSISLKDATGKINTIYLEVLYILPQIKQSLDLQATLGYQLTDSGHIKVDEGRRTNIPGLYAVGDNSSRFRSLSQAIASGMAAGAMINFDLIQKTRPLPVVH